MALIDEMYPELENVDLGFVYTGVGRQAEENKTVRLDFKSFQYLENFNIKILAKRLAVINIIRRFFGKDQDTF